LRSSNLQMQCSLLSSIPAQTSNFRHGHVKLDEVNTSNLTSETVRK
jgi:hypothetical protein